MTVSSKQFTVGSKQPREANPLKDGIFYQFAQDLCRVGEDLQKDRFSTLCWIIGYLLSPINAGEKHPVIFSDNGKNNRSGKSLLIKGIMHYMNQSNPKSGVTIDGHSFRDYDRFKFMELDETTELVHMDDVRTDFNFDEILHQLKHEVTVDKKGKAPFKVDAKFVLSTTEPIFITSTSIQASTIIFYLSNYYGPHKVPYEKYGLFFENWSPEEWNRTLVFMQFCEEIYEENPSFNPVNPAA